MLDFIFSFLAPFECLVCGREGALVCPSCLLKFPEAIERCNLCQKPSINGLTCPDCLQVNPLERVISFTLHQTVAKALIWQLKASGARSASRNVAHAIATRLGPFHKDLIITSAPTTNKRVRQRGYDQAVIIAKELSRITGLKYQKTLIRTGKVHQVGSSRRQRLSQLTAKFEAINPKRVSGKNYLIVDDVVTTGSTLRAAAKVLNQTGAKHIQAVTFTQA